VNVPRLIGAVISSGKATLHELDSVYGVESAYDMLEVAIIDAHNQRIIDESRRRQND
jgi:hypothetical protein